MWASVIFYLSSLEDPPRLFYFTHSDKVEHIMKFFLLTLLTLRGFYHIFKNKFPSYIYIVITCFFCLLFGVSDEWHQSFVPHRIPDAQDLASDALGVLAAGLIVSIFLFKQKRKSYEVL